MDADVDDVIAAEYLYQKRVLKDVVRDSEPKTQESRNNKEKLEKLSIRVSKKQCRYKHF